MTSETRTYVAHWANGDHSGAFEVDDERVEGAEAAARAYAAKWYGTETVITDLVEK